MAKKNSDLINTALWIGGGLLGYQLAAKGTFGASIQASVLKAKAVLLGGLKAGLPAGGGTGGGGGANGQLGDIGVMTGANPNIGSQISEWQLARRVRGENPLDWGAFRAHATAIYAPDPGPNPPAMFVNFR